MASLKKFEISSHRRINKLDVINKHLPRPDKALRWILLAPSGYGKSYLIKNILFNDDWGYKNFYDEIYCFIKSKDDVEEMRQLIIQNKMRKKVEIVQDFNNDDVKDLFEDIESDVEDGQTLNNVLFMFDDMVLSGISHSSKKSIIDEIFMRGRHANVSIIISSQRYKWLNQNMRVNNLNVLTLFYGTKSSELHAVAEEHSGMYEPDQLKKMFHQFLKQKYDFITIDYTADNPFKDKNFHNIIMKSVSTSNEDEKPEGLVPQAEQAQEKV